MIIKKVNQTKYMLSKLSRFLSVLIKIGLQEIKHLFPQKKKTCLKFSNISKV